MAARGVGPEVAATLLVSTGDNLQRMRSESAFAALCGASPVQASSGKVIRHRLNTGGDRQANNALWRIVMVRLTCDERTKRFAAERRAEGKGAKEIIRCLKRYVAREVFRLLTDPPPVLQGSDLRAARTKVGVSLAIVATAWTAGPLASPSSSAGSGTTLTSPPATRRGWRTEGRLDKFPPIGALLNADLAPGDRPPATSPPEVTS
ncbi:hypothetical protein BH20ACT1_BH20ACT1_08470 [soil metagenome]